MLAMRETPAMGGREMTTIEKAIWYERQAAAAKNEGFVDWNWIGFCEQMAGFLRNVHRWGQMIDAMRPA